MDRPYIICCILSALDGNHRCIYENRGCRKGRRRICPYPYRISDRRMALQNGDHKRAYRRAKTGDWSGVRDISR